jgi:protein tyrosine/serine phosphatase
LMPLLGAAIYAYKIAEENNFHQITKGEAYRSAQMARDELEHYINVYHIKSILNLRGKEPNERWYKEEIKVSAEKAVKHYDMFLSAYNEPTAEEVRILIGLIKSAPRPILIHCQAGADRSGLVAAMWKVIVDKESKSEAGKQLSILYGHWSLGPASAMDQCFKKWHPLLSSDKTVTNITQNINHSGN